MDQTGEPCNAFASYPSRACAIHMVSYNKLAIMLSSHSLYSSRLTPQLFCISVQNPLLHSRVMPQHARR